MSINKRSKPSAYSFLLYRKFLWNSYTINNSLRSKDAQLAVWKIMLRIPLARVESRKRDSFILGES